MSNKREWKIGDKFGLQGTICTVLMLNEPHWVNGSLKSDAVYYNKGGIYTDWFVRDYLDSGSIFYLENEEAVMKYLLEQ